MTMSSVEYKCSVCGLTPAWWGWRKTGYDATAAGATPDHGVGGVEKGRA